MSFAGATAWSVSFATEDGLRMTDRAVPVVPSMT